MSTPEPTAQPKVTRNVPPKRVRVNAGQTIGTPEGESFSEGDEVVLEGPVADEYQLAGHVTIIENVPDALDYEQADDHGVAHDVTQDRAQLGQHHDATQTQASEEDFNA